ncbi:MULTISPECIES: glutathione peroxidase [Silvimonas]|uniref:glutathione peroxidase n=1 Tax=Silvimonas TaxID=300264 RepID=UPI0024B34AA7|nr:MULTISPECIES: redoxin domain-containing protein [Silvimonas]MDR3430173.1 redoxin domain-containing protein [Silvimonas sp.]
MTQAVQNIPLQKIDGSAATLNDYAGKVLLVVNVASKCGLTAQYQGLEQFYRSHQAKGLEVLGFPANNFKGQEPGTNEEIASFCSTTYDVTFPLFAKISVVGEDQHPLYQALIAAQPDALGEGPFRERLSGKGIDIAPQPQVLWNFEKFLVNRKGEVVGRFSPDVTAEDARLVAAVEAELAKA